jgi:hypothetical protein
MGNEGNRRPHVVVVGGGFAELSAVRELGGAQPVSSRRFGGCRRGGPSSWPSLYWANTAAR